MHSVTVAPVVLSHLAEFPVRTGAQAVAQVASTFAQYPGLHELMVAGVPLSHDSTLVPGQAVAQVSPANPCLHV